MAYWTFANNGPLFSWVSIRNYVVVSASPLNAHKASNCEWECSGAHIRRTGLAFMPSLCLPPCWCLKHIPGILHASVIRMWCVPLILTRSYKLSICQPICTTYGRSTICMAAPPKHCGVLYSRYVRSPQIVNASTLNQPDSLPIHLYHALRIPLRLLIPSDKLVAAFDILPHILQRYGFSAASP